MHLPGPLGQLRGPLSAAVGLAATAANELKNLPDRAIELPMVAVSSVLQLSLRAQQRYAQLSARGEAVLSGHTPTEQPPPWATFDEPATPEQLRRAALNRLDSLVDAVDATDEASDGDQTLDPIAAGEAIGSAMDRAMGDSAGRHPSSKLFEELFGVGDPAAGDSDTATVTPIRRPAKKAAAKRPAVKKVAARKTAAKKTATRAAAAKKPAADGKPVSKPRDRAPSKFDDAE